MFFCFLDPPVCKSESTIIRAALKQTINITCDVDSNPIYNLTYKWHFNNSLETIVELPQPSALGGHGNIFIPSSNSNKNTDGIISDGKSSIKGNHYNKLNNNNNNSNRDGEWPILDDEQDDDDDDVELDDENTTELNVVENLPPYSSQMVYSNLVYQQHLDKNRKHHGRQKQTSSISTIGHYGFSNHGITNNIGINNGGGSILEYKKKFHLPSSSVLSNGIYRYRIETFSHYGTVSCIASNSIGHSTPCLYHIIAAGKYF